MSDDAHKQVKPSSHTTAVPLRTAPPSTQAPQEEITALMRRTIIAPQSITPQTAKFLQRAIGNHALAQLLHPPHTADVQRQEAHAHGCGCASCGGGVSSPELHTSNEVVQRMQCGKCGGMNSHKPTCPNYNKNKAAAKADHERREQSHDQRMVNAAKSYGGNYTSAELKAANFKGHGSSKPGKNKSQNRATTDSLKKAAENKRKKDKEEK